VSVHDPHHRNAGVGSRGGSRRASGCSRLCFSRLEWGPGGQDDRGIGFFPMATEMHAIEVTANYWIKKAEME
jgi:hypothetical protein